MPLWLYWILFGLVVGALAKFLVPGRDPAGCLFTTILGLIGAVLGGFLGARLGIGVGRISQPSFDLASIATATIGAMLVLVIGRIIRRATRRRPESKRD